eukprot:4273325-Pyramimonas_sp.AAC.1
MDSRSGAIRFAASARPLVLSDIGCETLSLAFTHPLNAVAEETVGSWQKGGVKGRDMTTNA